MAEVRPLREAILNCRACPRLRARRAQNAAAYPGYHNAPVPALGDDGAPMLILGLAPGLHGANRTGVPFTGDGSGDLLFSALKSVALGSENGLHADVRISNAVKCWPPQNKPRPSEIKLCQRFLHRELEAARVVVTLGRLAHEAVLRTLGLRLNAYHFGHCARHALGERWLFNSYHCSRYNQNTGRITQTMLADVLYQAHAQLKNL